MLREKILNYTVLAKGNGGKFVLGRIILLLAAFGNNHYLDGRIFTPGPKF